MDIKAETLELVNKIKETQEYIDYLNYRSILERNEELMCQVEEFRRKNFEIQVSHQYGAFNAYENLISLKQDYEALLNEPKVKMFLDAELKFSKLMASLYDTITEAIEFDTHFLE